MPQMHPNASSSLRSVASFLIVAAVYWVSLWRIIRGNRGNRVIECGSITLMLFFLMMLLIKLPSLPDWVLPSLGVLLLVLCLLTMFFLLAQGVHAIRHRKLKTVTLSDSVADYAVNELGYEPRSFRQKWLVRFVYWGTVLLVAVLLWMFVKVR